MSCLINFLSDTNQKSYINMIQNRDETYEKQLESYKTLFTDQLFYCVKKSGEKCKNVDCVCRVSCCIISKRIEEWTNNNRLRDKTIDFFNQLKICYHLWINSKITNALERFTELLKNKYMIIQSDEPKQLCLQEVENRVFFRARISNSYLTRKENFHISFNKRYLISNQRFSLTGLPLVYIGNSIADLLEEIGKNTNEITNLRISSFEFKNDSKNNISPPDKIFDLRCNIRQSISNPDKFSEQAFYRNILSHVCSFRKRKELEDAKFKEEYVIPQMLSIILKSNNYDGICYYSTKQFCEYSLKNVDCSVAYCDENMRYRENIALFTNENIIGNEYESYDKKLFEKLEISIPIAIENVDLHSINENEVQRLCEAINTRYADLSPTGSKLILVKKANRISTFFNDIFKNLLINNIQYTETEIGKMHVQLLIGILNRLLVEISLLQDD